MRFRPYQSQNRCTHTQQSSATSQPYTQCRKSYTISPPFIRFLKNFILFPLVTLFRLNPCTTFPTSLFILFFPLILFYPFILFFPFLNPLLLLTRKKEVRILIFHTTTESAIP